MTDDLLRCSFCGKSHTEVEKIIAGTNVYICNECVGICNLIIAGEQQNDSVTMNTPQCLFCGKPQNEVERIFFGRNGGICNDCVEICNELAATDDRNE